MKLRERLVAIGQALRSWPARLVHEHGDPTRLGAAVAFGVWVGCTPFYGIQTLIGLGLASMLSLNRLAVLLGLQISIPPLAPFLLFANAQVGAFVLRGHWASLSLEALRVPTSKLLAELLLDLLVGGAIVGAALAVPAGLLTTYLVRRRRRAQGVG